MYVFVCTCLICMYHVVFPPQKLLGESLNTDTYKTGKQLQNKAEIKLKYRQIHTEKYALKTVFFIFHALYLYLSVCIQGLHLSVCICMYRLCLSLSVCTWSGTTPTKYKFSLFHIFSYLQLEDCASVQWPMRRIRLCRLVFEPQ